MILNPPHIYQLLTAYQRIKKFEANEYVFAYFLSRIFIKYIGHPDFAVFVKTYQLYLQQIPLEPAKQAWGINQATFTSHLKSA